MHLILSETYRVFDNTVINLPDVPKLNSYISSKSKYREIHEWKKGLVFKEGPVCATYYLQAPGFTLAEHTDFSLCTYNFKIKGSSPIVFEGTPVEYNSILFNGKVRHMVPASSTERLILKISSDTATYSDLLEPMADILKGQVDYEDIIRTFITAS